MAGSRGNRMAADDRNAEIRAAIAASPERTAKRLSGLDRDAYDFSGYSDSDIVLAMKGGFGDEDYARLTGKPVGGSDPKPEPTFEPTPEPTPDPTPEPIIDGPTKPVRPVRPPIGIIGPGNGGSMIVDNSTNQTTGNFTGDVTGNNNTFDFSNTDNSTNTTIGGSAGYIRSKKPSYGEAYAPDFMRFLR